MRKLTLFCTCLLSVFLISCEEDKDSNDTKDLTWSEILSYFSGLSEFEAKMSDSKNGKFENVIIKFFIDSDINEGGEDDVLTIGYKYASDASSDFEPDLCFYPGEIEGKIGDFLIVCDDEIERTVGYFKSITDFKISLILPEYGNEVERIFIPNGTKSLIWSETLSYFLGLSEFEAQMSDSEDGKFENVIIKFFVDSDINEGGEDDVLTIGYKYASDVSSDFEPDLYFYPGEIEGEIGNFLIVCDDDIERTVGYFKSITDFKIGLILPEYNNEVARIFIPKK